MKALSPSEVAGALASVPEWRIEGGRLVREFRFTDFVAAIAFVDRVAVLAETANHHPDIDIRYNRVLLGLETHDAKGITVNDFRLAKAASAEFRATEPE